ncbi:MAG: DUF2247 family protein [Fimbriimonadaceae bacterium]
MKEFHVPVEFVSRHVKPTWSDVELGLHNRWLNSADAVKLAVQIVAADESASREEVMLAASDSSKAVEIAEQVQALAKAESEGGQQKSRQRWLYLLLAWVYENRASVADPLSVVEEIYSNFGYPEEVAAFVRYMPPKNDEYWPQLPTKEENDERLMGVWADYISRGVVK